MPVKILLAVDDSPHSGRAVDFVVRMRWPAGSRVIVLSVVHPGAADTSLPGAPVEPAGTAVLASAPVQADDFVAHAVAKLRASGLSAESRLVEGNPPEELIHVANDEHVDLLVVGSHGRTGLARLMLGSVSSSAVVHAPCSVLVIKKPKFV